MFVLSVQMCTGPSGDAALLCTTMHPFSPFLRWHDAVCSQNDIWFSRGKQISSLVPNTLAIGISRSSFVSSPFSRLHVPCPEGRRGHRASDPTDWSHTRLWAAESIVKHHVSTARQASSSVQTPLLWPQVNLFILYDFLGILGFVSITVKA